MADERRERLPHILIKDTATTRRYTRPTGGTSSGLNLPSRNGQTHAEPLNQLTSIQEEDQTLSRNKKPSDSMQAGVSTSLLKANRILT